MISKFSVNSARIIFDRDKIVNPAEVRFVKAMGIMAYPNGLSLSVAESRG